MNINEVLQTGREALLKNGIDPRETRLLLAFAMEIRHDELIKYKECSEKQYEVFLELIKRRVSGEPYAYIVGYKEFMKLKFKVTSDVLIPRDDTEVLVQEIIDISKNAKSDVSDSIVGTEILKISSNLSKKESIKILDMCTGSGCIAISLAKYIKNSEVTAVDISKKALKIARENAIINEVKVNFVESNLFENLSESFHSEMISEVQNLQKEAIHKNFDIIVSNPPYIRRNVIETLQEEVKNEPMIALDGGVSGLEFYEEITCKSKEFLNEDGILAFEIGFDQGEAVSEIMKRNNFRNIIVKKDMSENDRIVIGIK